jgi:ribokinase
VSSARGTNLIVIDRGANGDFLPIDVAGLAEEVAAADVAVSPLEIPLQTALAAARVAKAAGRRFILNPAPAEDLRGHDLSQVFALTHNECESRVCLGSQPNATIADGAVAEQLLALGVEHVIMTRGDKGVLWASHAGLEEIPALEVQVVDTVGAGDALNAGVAVGMSEGRPVREAIAMGVVAASISTQRRETIESYPRRTEVQPHIGEVLRRARVV